MKAILRIVFLVISLTLFCAYPAVTNAQDQSGAAQQQVPATGQQLSPAQSRARDATQPSAGARRRQLSDSALATLVGAFIALLAYKLNRSIAYRTVTIEAQKLLVEINKQYISDPTLLIIEDEYNAPVKMDAHLNAKLRAMAYLKLNVFEIIFATLPWGQSRRTWKTYFEESLKASSLLGKELEKHRAIYHRALIRAYDDWKEKRIAPIDQRPKSLRKRLFKRRRRGRT